MSKDIKVKLPKGFMNVSITTSNNLTANTNDSANWDDLIFPLPKGQWKVKKYEGDGERIVILTRN